MSEAGQQNLVWEKPNRKGNVYIEGEAMTDAYWLIERVFDHNSRHAGWVGHTVDIVDHGVVVKSVEVGDRLVAYVPPYPVS